MKLLMAALRPTLFSSHTCTCQPRLLCSLPQGNVKLLMDDVAALRPTLFIAVPRILERVEDGGESCCLFVLSLSSCWFAQQHPGARGGRA